MEGSENNGSNPNNNTPYKDLNSDEDEEGFNNMTADDLLYVKKM